MNVLAICSVSSPLSLNSEMQACMPQNMNAFECSVKMLTHTDAVAYMQTVKIRNIDSSRVVHQDIDTLMQRKAGSA